MFWEHEGNAAVRIGTLEAGDATTRAPWELYDMDADRTELHDLAAQHPDRVPTWRAQYDAWAAALRRDPAREDRRADAAARA